MTYERKMLPENVVEYSISGEFVIFFINNLRIEMEEDVKAGNVNYFMFDFDKVSFIDSASVGLLIMAGRFNEGKGRSLPLKNVKEKVRITIDNANLPFVEYL